MSESHDFTASHSHGRAYGETPPLEASSGVHRVARDASGFPSFLDTPRFIPFSSGDARASGVYGAEARVVEASRRPSDLPGGQLVNPILLLQSGIVWHYSDGTGVASIVGNRELWATSVSSLNDAGELTYGLRRICGALREAKKTAGGVWLDHLENLLREMDDSARHLDRTYVACASMSSNSLSQWRAYSGNGVGYAIGLDCNEKLAVVAGSDVDIDASISKTMTLGWLPVLYDPAQQRSLAQDTVAYALYNLEWGCPVDSVMTEIVFSAICMKHPSFKDEEEVRYVTQVYEENAVQFRGGKYGITPYVRLTAPQDGGINEQGTILCVHGSCDSLPIVELNVGPGKMADSARRGAEKLLRHCGFSEVSVSSDESPIRW